MDQNMKADGTHPEAFPIPWNNRIRGEIVTTAETRITMTGVIFGISLISRRTEIETHGVSTNVKQSLQQNVFCLTSHWTLKRYYAIWKGSKGTHWIEVSLDTMTEIYFLCIHPMNGFLCGSEFDKAKASRHTYWKEDLLTLRPTPRIRNNAAVNCYSTNTSHLQIDPKFKDLH